MKSRLATIVILILFAAAAALLVFFAPFIAHGQPATNLPAVEPATPVATELTPQAVAQSFTAWNAVALLIGGVIWHIILKVAPWAKANGGLLRGVIRFFWDTEPVVKPPKLVLTGTGTEQKPPPA
jgi:hypothetical protein